MNKIEEFYKEAGGIEYDKFDKKANKFTYYDMIGFADAYHSKQLNIPIVGNRRELLIDFMKFMYKDHWKKVETAIKQRIDKYIKGN